MHIHMHTMPHAVAVGRSERRINLRNMDWISWMRKQYRRHDPYSGRLRSEYQEQRLVTLGLLRGTVVVIAHLEGPGWIRVISMRKATRREQILFFESI